MPRRPQNHQPALLEALEARSLFDLAAFASVGLAFETRELGEILTTVYATEGTMDTVTGNATGTTFAGSDLDRFATGPLLFSSIDNLASGLYRRNPNRGTQGEPIESNGARFLTRDGFPAGWWFADFGDGEKEVEWIVERPTNATPADFEGTWRFASIGDDNSNDDFSNAFGNLVIDATSVQWHVDAGSLPRVGSSILSTTSDGLLRTSAREYFYMSRDGSVLVFADMAEDDQQIYIGVAVREAQQPFAGDLVGDYLLAWAFADGPAADGPNGEVDYAQRYVSLSGDGHYRIWDLDDYDSGFTGDQFVINHGDWFISGGELVLQEDGTGNRARFTIADNGSTLIGNLLQDSQIDDPVLGLATRAFPLNFPPAEPLGVFTIPGEGSFGRQLVYELGEDGTWEVTDLVAEAGGPVITGPVVSWTDPKDGHAYAAGMTSSGVFLYSEPDAGDWTLRSLSDETGGEAIVAGLQVMISPDNVVSLTGLNASGQLVRYYQLAGQVGNGGYEWAFTNIETNDLVAQGQQTPAFAGALISYATSWGGLNVAGLDAAGRIWSVWWAPGLAHWTVTDLSASSGAGPIAGGLAVYLTPWDGINLAGIDAAGDLQVTWWVPGFGGAWAKNNLTAETGGPKLRPGSVTSYVSSWGALNVAGIDDATGEVQVYWWVPEHTTSGWEITSITNSLPPGGDRISDDDIRGVAAPDNSLNIFGYAADGSFLCYYWQSSFGGTWQVQNLSDISVDR